MLRVLLLFTLLILTSITHAAGLEGQWEGSGHVTYTQSSKDLDPCEKATIHMVWAEPDLIVNGWSTCVIDWDNEPLTFLNGQIFRRDLPIGTYTRESFQFEYHSAATAMVYSVRAWIENETLVMEEYLDVPNLWWSKGYYKFQRK